MRCASWQAAPSATGSRTNNACRRDILERLRADGPLPSRELPDTCVQALGVDRLEQQQERHDDARPPRAARRGRGRRRDRARPAVGPGVPGLPGRPRDPVGGGAPAARRAPAERARHRPVARPGVPGRAAGRRRGRGAGRGRGGPRPVAGRPGAARTAVRRPRRPAVAVRPAAPRPQADERGLRVRLPPRDVQARRQAPVGLLRPADPVRRPAGREARRQGRPQGRACSASRRSTRTCRSARP